MVMPKRDALPNHYGERGTQKNPPHSGFLFLNHTELLQQIQHVFGAPMWEMFAD